MNKASKNDLKRGIHATHHNINLYSLKIYEFGKSKYNVFFFH